MIRIQPIKLGVPETQIAKPTAARARIGSTTTAVWMLVLPFLLLSLSFVFTNSGDATLLPTLGLIGTCATVTYATYNFCKRKGINPVLLVGYCLFFSANFGFSSLKRSPEQSLGFAANLTSNDIRNALLLCALGIVSWSVAFHITPIPGIYDLLNGWARRIQTRQPLPARQLRSRLFVVFIVGLLGHMYAFLTKTYGYISENLTATVTSFSPLANLLSRISGLTLFAVILSMALWRTTRAKTDRFLFYVILATNILLGLISGMKSLVFIPVFAAVLTQLSFGFKLRIRALVILFILAGFTTGFVGSYRNQVRSGDQNISQESSIRLAPKVAGEVISSASPLIFAENISILFFGRFRAIDTIALVQKTTPREIPYIPISQTLLSSASTFIPRALWPNKPANLSGIKFAQMYMGQGFGVVSASTPYVIGDSYMRGGVWGVIAIMALLGFLCRTFSTNLWNVTDWRMLTIGIPLFFDFANFEMDFQSRLASMTLVTLISYLAARYTFRD